MAKRKRTEKPVKRKKVAKKKAPKSKAARRRTVARPPSPPRHAPIHRKPMAPLNSLWFVSSILGILISVAWVSKYSLPWAAAFTVVFAAMFFAGMVSMRRAMPDDQLLPVPKKIR